jgi:hypothetical protein
MRTRQTIIWTALPQGFVGDRLRITVFVTPRLESPDATRAGATLADFPTFVHWAETIKGVNFKVEFEGFSPVKDEQVTRVMPAPPTAFWDSLFNERTFVRPYAFDDLSGRNFISYPVADALAFIRGQYQKVATQSPADMPLVSFLLGDTNADGNPVTGDPSGFDPVAPRARDHIRDPARMQATAAFDKVGEFHRRLSDGRRATLPRTDEEFERLVDFHQMVSLLADYPELLTRMGLAVELLVPKSWPEVKADKPGHVRVTPVWTHTPANDHMDFSPSTAYVLQNQARIFAPAPRNTAEVENGVLKVSSAPYELVQVDVDGAAIKALNFVESMKSIDARQQTDAAAGLSSQPTRAGVPTIRSGGLSVVRGGRAKDFKEGLGRPKSFDQHVQRKRALMKTNPTSAEIEERATRLRAEDIVRGYRVDVLDEHTGKWHSLCVRDGEYFFLNAPDAPNVIDGSLPTTDIRHSVFERRMETPLSLKPWKIRDEGFVKMGLTGPTDGSTTDLRLHESLFHWDGWSLAAPRPGRHIGPNGKPLQELNLAEQARTDFKLVASFVAARGSLPRLRFGRRYGLRVRTVDLAGRSLTLEEANANAQAGALVPYLRFEPVAAPVVVMDEEHQPRHYPGESLERLVVRSNFDTTAKAYAARFGQLMGNAKYKPAARRLIAPPKATQLMAEMHGVFDDPATGRARADAYQLISHKAEGAYRPAQDKSADDVIANKDKRPDSSLDPVAPASPFDLPYLPDPLARGAALRFLPGAGGQLGRLVVKPAPAQPLRPDVLRLPFKRDSRAIEYVPLSSVHALGDFASERQSAVLVGFDLEAGWPNFRPFFIALTEPPARMLADDPGRPVWDDKSRTLFVQLAQAETRTIRLSSFFGTERLADFALEMMGVWQWMKEAKGLGAQQLDMLRQLALLGMHWMLTPYREVTLVHAVQQPLAAPTLQGVTFAPGGRATREEGDTYALLEGSIGLHAKSTGKIDLIARWDEQRDSLAAPKPQTIKGSAHVIEKRTGLSDWTLPFDWKLDPSDPERRRMLDRRVRHEFGDTRYRRVRYQTIATSSFREYFEFKDGSAPNASALDFTRVSTETDFVIIPSSARPTAPKVRYVVPAFKWTRTDPANFSANVTTRVSTRTGALRVFLERPWFSSGDDERLAVVLAPGPAPSDAIKPYVTQWANDPIRVSASPAAQLPAPSNFPRRLKEEDDTVWLSEPNSGSVMVASHKVQYDEQRQLWYCDIEVDAGAAYFPFLRLALARYQPSTEHAPRSVEGVELSRVVLTDIVQLVPTRTTTVKLIQQGKDFELFEVTVKGSTYTGVAGSNPKVKVSSKIEVTAEWRDPKTGGELDWIEDDPAVNESALSEGEMNSQSIIWKGNIRLGFLSPPPERRIVVKEWESLSPTPAMAGGDNDNTKRLVYAEHFTAPPILAPPPDFKPKLTDL